MTTKGNPEETFTARPDMTAPWITAATATPQPTETTFALLLRESVDADGGGKATSVNPSFILHNMVGRGGVGEVWEATQTTLERTVAVKRIAASVEAGSERPSEHTQYLNHQFCQEAIITGQLEHPNIVPVYDLGYDGEGKPLLAMKLVRGKPWSAIIRKDREALDFEDFLFRHLKILLDVSQAIAYAHSMGVVHRDIKPSQVMVGQYGEVLVMDWGLAMVCGPPAPGQSGIHAVSIRIPDRETAISPAGTPSFMAPEQTHHSAIHISNRTDVYLLGGTLYYLLTGAYPHDGETRDEAMSRAADGVVIPPTKRAPDLQLPPSLVKLTLDALKPNPEERIASAEEFSRGIQDYMSGSSARRESMEYSQEAAQILKRLDENSDRPGESVSIYQDLTGAINLLDKAVATWPRNPEVAPLRNDALYRFARRALQENDLTLARIMAERLDDRKGREVLLNTVRIRQERIERENRQRKIAFGAVGLLVILIALGGFQYWRDQSRAFKELQTERDRSEVARERAEELQALAESARREVEREYYFSAIGIASTSVEEGRTFKVEETLYERTPSTNRNWEWGYLAATINQDEYSLRDGKFFSAAHSPDGELIAIGGHGDLEVRNTSNGELQWAMEGVAQHLIWGVAWSPDARRIAIVGFDWRVYIIDVEEQVVLHEHIRSALQRAVAFSPDGKHLISGGRDQVLAHWDVETGSRVREFGSFDRDIYTAFFTEDGSRVITASLDNRASIWDFETGGLLFEFKSEDALLDVDISECGTMLLTGGVGHKVYLVDLESGEPIHVIDNRGDYIHTTRFVPGGKYFLVGDDAGVASIRLVETGEVAARFMTLPPLFHVRPDKQGTHFLTISPDKLSKVNLDRVLGTFTREELEVVDLVARPFYTRLRVYGVPQARDVNWLRRHLSWHSPTGLTHAASRGAHAAVESRLARHSHDLKMAVRFDFDRRTASVVEPITNEILHTPEMEIIHEAAFSPDDRLLAVAADENLVHLYNTETWELKGTIVQNPNANLNAPVRERYFINSLAFSPDGKTLAIGYLNQRVALWDVESISLKKEITELDGVGINMAFSNDGRYLALVGNANVGYLYSLEKGEVETTFVGHGRTILQVAFSPDDSRIVTISSDRNVKLWETDTGFEVLNLYRSPPDSSPIGVAFSRDGRDILIAISDGTFKALRAFPWKASSLPGTEEETIGLRLEAWKRLDRLPQSSPSPLPESGQ
ncbi:MAG: protein kinase [Candidatus Sumerlaeia bacterium]|nr:protein kinase [Candidatus Sumerlaeia bacterium]